MNTKTTQLTLPIGLDDVRSFDNFVEGSNARLVEHLKGQVQRRASHSNQPYSGIFLWGDSNVGKTHLLCALAQLYGHLGGEVCCLDSKMWVSGQPLGLGVKQIYILDDIEEFITDPDNEEALLSLVERVKQAQGLLLVTAQHSANQLSIDLPDLASRIKAMDSFELIALDDALKGKVVRQRALQRGMILSSGVVNWLFSHTSRDLGKLLDLLEQMDVTSLAQKRKVTIPLIKAMLSEQ